MRNKGHKVNRYRYEWSGQRKQWWKRALGVLAIVAAAGLVGWFGYDPVYRLVMDAQQNRVASSTSSQLEQQSQSQSTGSLPAEPEQPAEPEEAGLPTGTYYLPTDTLLDDAAFDAALEQIKQAGGVGVAFDLKDDIGTVLYRSDLPEVAQYLVQSETPFELARVVERIRTAGLMPVGRIFTFRDSRATSAAAMSEGCVKYMDSKINWLDNAKADGGRAWLNANSELARGYILKLVEETTAAGVHMLLLDGVQFPTGLSLHLATFGGTPVRSQVLAGFLSQAAELAAANDARIYPVLRLDEVAGVSAIRYGDQPELLAMAAEGALLDIRPEQFGIGVTTERLTLLKPLQTPYESLTAALEAAGVQELSSKVQLAGMVQCYTSALVESTANRSYSSDEVNEQVIAANQAGIERIVYFSPDGRY